MKIVTGITGASGVIYGIRTIELLKKAGVETHLVMSDTAAMITPQETDYRVGQVKEMADVCYDFNNMGAAIASGSFGTDGMIVAPCTIKTLSAIANSYTDNLLVRAADVTLKEGKPLILVLRETPLHAGHIRLMEMVTRAGAIIFPPVPALYSMPKTIDEMITNTVGRVLHRMGIQNSGYKQWTGMDTFETQ